MTAEQRLAAVQGDNVSGLSPQHPAHRAIVECEGREPKPTGTVAWWEHEAAWDAYAARYGRDQSAERIHERHGFGYGKLLLFQDTEDEMNDTTYEARKLLDYAEAVSPHELRGCAGFNADGDYVMSAFCVRHMPQLWREWDDSHANTTSQRIIYTAIVDELRRLAHVTSSNPQPDNPQLAAAKRVVAQDVAADPPMTPWPLGVKETTQQHGVVTVEYNGKVICTLKDHGAYAFHGGWGASPQLLRALADRSERNARNHDDRNAAVALEVAKLALIEANKAQRQAELAVARLEKMVSREA